MGFRITTNMMMNTYRYNLQNNTKKLSDARDMVLTQRRFSSYAEDPAAATLAFRLRRDYLQSSSYLANTKDVYSKFNTAWHNLAGVIKDLSDNTARMASIRGVTGTAGESRGALAVVLRQTAESVIQALNQKMGDHFIFGGNDALNAPFSWSEDMKTLYYRGANVNAGAVKYPSDPPGWGDISEVTYLPVNMPAKAENAYEREWMEYYHELASDLAKGGDGSGIDKPFTNKSSWVGKLEDYIKDGTKTDYVLDKFGTPNVEAIRKSLGVAEDAELPDEEQAWLDYFQDQADVRKLQAMSGEEMYIDLGLGAAEKSPNSPIKGTYFNSALCGIDFIGCGVDKDGDPKNLALIMRELADVFDCWDEDMDPQGYNPDLAKDTAKGLSSDELAAKAERLMDKLKAAQENTTEKYTELNANSTYLQSNEAMLTVQQTDLNIQILDLEQVDLAEAITAFSWEQYCYNAALKIGNQLLSQSLIDYMN